MKLLERCYNALKASGIDVRLANTATGACTAQYAVAYDGAVEPAGKTLGYRHVLVDILVPHDQADKLSGYAAEVRAAMAQTGLTLVYATQAETLDDYKAIAITMDYRALCAID